MPLRTWTLTDHEQRTHVDRISLTPKSAGGEPARYCVTKHTLAAGLSQGVDVIEVQHGDFRFTVVPTRGMGIWRASLGELSLGWKSPVRGPVHPAFVHSRASRRPRLDRRFRRAAGPLRLGEQRRGGVPA